MTKESTKPVEEKKTCRYYMAYADPKGGKNCYNYEPQNHDFYSCAPYKACEICFHYKAEGWE